MNTKTNKILLFLILFSFITSFIPQFIPTVQAAGPYYVATTGNDAGTGAIGDPFKTLWRAINETTNGTGEDIIIRGGTYTPTGVTHLNRDGTTGDWMTISNYTGETVIINGTNIPLTAYFNAILELDNSEYIRITGIHLERSQVMGITLNTGNNNITIDNCTIANASSSALKVDTAGQSYITLENSLIYGNEANWSGPDVHSVGQETISFSGVTHFEIHNNTFLNNHFTNIDLKSGTNTGSIHHNIINTTATLNERLDTNYWGWTAILIDCRGIVHNVSIYNNLFYGNNTGIWLNSETATGRYENISIYNNVINMSSFTKQALGTGIKLEDTGGSTSVFKDINIYMNTINMNDDVMYKPIWGRSSLSKGRLSRLTISNNIFTNNNKTSGSYSYYIAAFEGVNSTDGKITLSNNLYYNFLSGATLRIYWKEGAYTTSTASKWGTNPLFTNPLYTSRVSGNFHINQTSPCTDTATSSLYASTDYDDNIRPINLLYDMGAYEFTGVAPTVTTNTTTELGSISGKMWGSVIDNGTIDIISYGIQYGTTTGMFSGATWYGNILGPFYLSSVTFNPGTKYYYRAFASNSYTIRYGTTETFITQPYPPVSITGTSTNSTTIVLTWAKGTGANYTRIQRATTGYPSDIGDGSNVYNGTASLYANTGLTPGTLYYFSSWSMTLWGTETKWNSTVNSSTYTLTRPDPPANLIGNQCANLTYTWVNWTNGTGKDYNVVVKKVGGIPSTPADGTVIYNGTDNHTLATVTSGDNNYYRVWSLAKETSPSTSAWSATAPYVSISGILPGSIVTVHPGVYFSVGNTNYSVGSIMNFTQIILTSSTSQFNDTNFSTVPTPTSTKVNVTLNFLHDDTTMTIPGTLLINMSVDTPVSTVPISFGVQGLHASMSYMIYHNGLNDSTAASDATGTITFTNTSGAWDGTTQYYEIYFSHGGAYGGLTIGVYNETDKLPLIFNCTIVNHTGTETIVYRNQTGPIVIGMATLPKGEQVAVIVDARNHEMRTYYLDIVTGLNYNLEAYLPYTITPLLPTNITYLYYFTVIDEGGYTISNVRYYVYGLTNYTSYVLMQDGYTDGNGKFNVWLLPGRLYKVTLSKTGYQNDTYDYITGTTDYSHIFKLLYETGGTTTTYYFNEQIHTSAYRDNITSILYVNYTDDMSMTINCQIYIYEINGSTGASALFFFYTTTGDSDFTFNTPVNNSNSYEIIYKFNHSYFDYKTAYILIRGYKATFTSETEFNAMFVINFGYNPFGWSNVITWFIMVGCFFSFNRRDSYMAMILAAFFLLIINFYIGFNTIMSGVAGGAIPVMMILFGILMLIRDRYRFGVDM